MNNSDVLYVIESVFDMLFSPDGYVLSFLCVSFVLVSAWVLAVKIFSHLVSGRRK